MQRLKSSRDLEEKKAVLLAKLEEAEEGERAALLEASRIREDNEGLKVSQSDSHFGNWDCIALRL